MDGWSDCGEVNVTPETSYIFSRRYIEGIFRDSCEKIRKMSPKLFEVRSQISAMPISCLILIITSEKGREKVRKNVGKNVAKKVGKNVGKKVEKKSRKKSGKKLRKKSGKKSGKRKPNTLISKSNTILARY